MIRGIGTDLCAVARIEKSLGSPAFVRRVYAPAEQALLAAHSGQARAQSAAANFAAKEAFLKACSVGLGGFALAEIAVLRAESGAPYIQCAGAAAEFLARERLSVHVSLSHEAGLAAAFVVLETVVPNPND